MVDWRVARNDRYSRREMVAADGETGWGWISKRFLCIIWKKRNERPNVGGVSIRSRNGLERDA